MPFKKGTSGNPIGRPKGSVSTASKLIREHMYVFIPKWNNFV